MMRQVWLALSLVAVVILGFLHLPHPLGGDQALFLLGAQAMDDGAALYRDFWDLKQPGVYLFFWVGGKLFGFTEYGVHLFELVYLAAFAALVGITARACLSRWAAALAPLAVTGSYYLISTPWGMTQVEWLAAFPIYGSLSCMVFFWRTRTSRIAGHFAAGCAAAVAATFKLAFLPILVLAALVTTYWLRRRTHNGWQAILVQRWLPAATGFALTVIPVMVWLTATGGFERFVWTTFVYPVEAMRMGGSKSVAVLGEAIAWFVLRFGVWLGGAAFAVWRWNRDRRHLFPILLAVWLAGGFLVIAVQRISWWPYHFQLLIAPAVLLALYGLDKAKPKPWTTALFLILAFAPAVALMARKASLMTWDAAWNRREAVLDYQRKSPSEYDQIWRDTRFLTRPGATPGPIYVFGNPLYLHLAGRRQAIPENGWGWDTATESQWENLPAQLAAARPAYLYVDRDYLGLMRKRGAKVLALLDTDYEFIETSSTGTWYRAKRASLSQLPTRN